MNLLEDNSKMKGFIQEYGNIIVVVAVVLLMLLFGKTGFAKNIQDAILGSANHIVETGESINDKEPGDILEIGGKKYIVVAQTGSDTYELISGESIGSIQYQPNQDSNGNYYNIGQYNANDEQDKRYDGQDSNTYEDSYIDKFLENTWYASLSPEMQNAIVATQINQSAYKEIGHGTIWKLLLDTDKTATDGSDWYYNEGTIDNPKWVVYYKHKWVETDEGIFPLKSLAQTRYRI